MMAAQRFISCQFRQPVLPTVALQPDGGSLSPSRAPSSAAAAAACRPPVGSGLPRRYGRKSANKAVVSDAEASVARYARPYGSQTGASCPAIEGSSPAVARPRYATDNLVVAGGIRANTWGPEN
jgi:hypothetical protein